MGGGVTIYIYIYICICMYTCTCMLGCFAHPVEESPPKVIYNSSMGDLYCEGHSNLYETTSKFQTKFQTWILLNSIYY